MVLGKIIRLIRVIAYNLINNTENLIVPKIKDSYFFQEDTKNITLKHFYKKICTILISVL